MHFSPFSEQEPPTLEEVTAHYLALIPTFRHRAQLQAFWRLTSFLPKGPQKACIRAALLARVKALGWPLKPLRQPLIPPPGASPDSRKAPCPASGRQYQRLSSGHLGAEAPSYHPEAGEKGGA